MKQDKITNPFDNLLMAYITYEGQGNFVSTSFDKEAEIVFSKQFETTLPKEKVNILLSSLSQSLSKETLGTLVSKALVANTLPEAELQSKTGLSSSLLEAIKSDMIFTNSVPIKSLVRLLKLINISLGKAQSAINATFEKLSTESKLFLSVPSKAQPAFRKGTSFSSTNFDFKRLKSDESYLYQNKEALEKYAKRFTELYDEI